VGGEKLISQITRTYRIPSGYRCDNGCPDLDTLLRAPRAEASVRAPAPCFSLPSAATGKLVFLVDTETMEVVDVDSPLVEGGEYKVHVEPEVLLRQLARI
jgi:hypothetical protein